MLMVCAIERSAMWLDAKGNADVVCALTSKRLISKRVRPPCPLVYVAHKSLPTALRHRLLRCHRPHLHWLSYAKCQPAWYGTLFIWCLQTDHIAALERSYRAVAAAVLNAAVISIEKWRRVITHYHKRQSTITHAKERPTNRNKPIKYGGVLGAVVW